MARRAASLRAASLLAALLLGMVGSVQAQPYRPRSDADVIERLPLRSRDAAERARVRALQAQLRTRRDDLAVALPAAREAIARARRSGDPRELGQAQGWLAPWWSDAGAPPAVRLLKATVLQSQHAFDDAVHELDGLLARPDLPAPLRAQALLTRAAVWQVRGRWDLARTDCERLAAPPMALPHGAACLAELDSLQGRGGDPARRLDALARAPGAPVGWLTLLRAELAERQGQPAAQGLYQRALALEDDIYTRAAYADWLLARQRWQEAAALIQPADGSRDALQALQALPDAWLLRLAIATRGSGDARAGRVADEMRRRLQEAALRGDSGHARERARFELDVLGRPAAALEQAQANWTVQKEPADAWLFLRAAKAAGQPQAAEPVRRFIREQGLRDVRLEALL